jgi:ribosome-binding factor A
MLAGRRAVRVGDQILREIALLLLERVKDPRVRDVTVTGISLSNDLKLARVYYSVMGNENEAERAQSGLDRAKGFIKREIGLRMSLRYIPQITFVHDPTLESGSRMDRVFKKIRKTEEKECSD